MFHIKIFIVASVAIIFFQMTVLGYDQAHGRNSEFMMGHNSDKYNNSSYVSYRTDPHHYNIAGNATRTCGKGYNPMSKQHRRAHQYKRSHSHPYVPWRPGCTE